MPNVVLPPLGEGILKATVSYWFFNEGDAVQENDDLVEMATDKATFNVPARVSGVLKEKRFAEGDTVQVGEVLAVIA